MTPADGDRTDGPGRAGAVGVESGFNRNALKKLLEIVGPDDAAEFLGKMDADLTSVFDGLGKAIARKDPAEMRAQSHILIAIAGTVGAEGLQANAQRLNALARGAADPAALGSLAARVRHDLAALIAWISAERCQATLR